MVELPVSSLFRAVSDRLFPQPRYQTPRPNPTPGHATSTPLLQPTQHSIRTLSCFQGYSETARPRLQSSRPTRRARGPHRRPDDDRMPPPNDIDRNHFLQDNRHPRDAIAIPQPRIASSSESPRAGRAKPKPGASHAPKPMDNLKPHTFSPYSGTVKRPHRIGSKPHQDQSYAAKARTSSDRGTFLDLPESASDMRPSKRLKTEAMHRSQSSPAGPTVDLTEEVLPSTPSKRQHTGTVGQHGKSHKAHSIDSDSVVELRNRSGYFSTSEFVSVDSRINSFKAPKTQKQEQGSTRQPLKTVADPAVEGPVRHSSSLVRLLETISEPTPNLGTFKPSPRRKEKDSHKKTSESPKSQFKSLPKYTSNRPWRLEVFGVPSTIIWNEKDALALDYHPQRARHELVNKDGPIVMGTEKIFIDTGNVKDLVFSETAPWRVQIIYHRPGQWQRFTFQNQLDCTDFLNYMKMEIGSGKIMKKTADQMMKIFETPNPQVSPIPREQDQESAWIRDRIRQQDRRPRQYQSDDHLDIRRERPPTLVSQMRPGTEKTSDGLEPPGMEQPAPNNRRLTRSTNRIMDYDYPFDRWDINSELKEDTARKPKLSEDPGFGSEWPRPVKFPPSGRYQSEVCFSDLKRLEDGEFWNDSVISFCMAWSLHQAKDKSGFDESRIHIFSTYFCNQLWEPPTTNSINYDAVKRWTAKIDLFSRDYIVVPVNDNEHWHLAIIVNMKNAGKRFDNDAATSVETPQADEVQPQSELKQGLIKTLGPGKSGKLNAQSNGNLNSPVRDVAKKRSANDSNRISILVFDSLGATHPKTVKTLKQYIIAEARSKRGLELTVQDIQGINVREIPLQPNGYDCGVFVCGYFDKFISDPDSFVRKVLCRQMNQSTDWPDLDPLKMRRDTLKTLLSLQQQQQKERKREQKMKRLEAAEKQKSATPKDGSPETPPADLTNGNALPAIVPPQPSTDLSASVQEILPESREKKALRSRSPQVVIIKNLTPQGDSPAENPAAETSLIKRSHDDNSKMVDRPSKKPKVVETKSGSPTKKSKSPQSQTREDQKEALKAEAHSAAERTSDEFAELDQADVAERPSRNRRMRERESMVPETPPHMHTEANLDPIESGHSAHCFQSEYKPRKVHKVPRPAPIQSSSGDQDNDDEFIEETSEVDLVRYPQYRDDESNDVVYADSGMQESQQVGEDLRAWRRELLDEAYRHERSKKGDSPERHRPDSNDFKQHEVITLTDDE